MIILSRKISSAIWYDNFLTLCYHQWYDMRNLSIILSWTLWYDNFPGVKYHQWYDMIFFSKKISSMIRYDILREDLSSTIWYDNFFVFITIYIIGCDWLKTKLSFPRITIISKNFAVLFWLTDFSVLKFQYHFWYEMIILNIKISFLIWYDNFENLNIIFDMIW